MNNAQKAMRLTNGAPSISNTQKGETTMAFVYEKIPDDFREKYQINKLNHGRGHTIVSYSADKEREIFLVHTGVNREGGTEFWLFWNDNICEATSTLRSTKGNVDVYVIFSLRIPVCLKNKVEEIKLFFSEAMAVERVKADVEFTESATRIVGEIDRV